MKFNIPIAMLSLLALYYSLAAAPQTSSPEETYGKFAEALAAGEGDKATALIHLVDDSDKARINSLERWITESKSLFDSAEKKIGKGAGVEILDGLPVPNAMRLGRELKVQLDGKKAVIKGSNATLDVSIGTGLLIQVDGNWKVASRSADGRTMMGECSPELLTAITDVMGRVAKQINAGEVKTVAEALAAFSKG